VHVGVKLTADPGMVLPPKPCGTVSKSHGAADTPVGTVRNALNTGTVARATMPRPLPPSSSESPISTPTMTKAPSLPPSMSGRALPSLPPSESKATMVAHSGTASRSTARPTDTMRHAPEPQAEPHHEEDDQMLDGVIIPALNNVRIM